jgi:hypothetical protein
LNRCFFTASLLLALLAGPASAITLSFAPSQQTLGLNQTTTVDLQISGLGNGVAPSLGAYDINLTFDPAIVALVGAPVFGNGLNVLGLGSFNGYATATASVEVWDISLDSVADLNSLQADAFTLATLSFQAVGYGTGALGIDVIQLGDAAGAPLSYQSAAGAITVPAAEPPAVAVFALSLAALALSRRPRAKRA